MKAVVLEEFGADLALRDVPRPVPAAGEVLVRVAASGVNPLDTKIRAGAAAHARVTPPMILGIDLAGIVAEVGPGVTGFAVGDEVYGMTGGVGDRPGSLAEYAAVDADLLARKPARLSMSAAAALPLALITAWEGLVDRAGTGAGDLVLVHGGAGGVGHVAVQLALARGATVFATGSGASLDAIRRLGAEPIDYRATTAPEYVASATGGEGFDVIFDTVGGKTLDDSFAAVRAYTGHVVSILGWGSHSLAPLSFRGATYSGVFTLLPLLTGRGRAHHGDILAQAAALADAGLLTPMVDPTRFSLETVADAHRAVETGTSAGKVVVQVATPGGRRGTTRAFGRKGLHLRGRARFSREEFEPHPPGQLAVAWAPRSRRTRGLAAQQAKEPVMGLGKQAKDKAKEIKGKVKKDTGKATGNNRLKVKGKAEELTGKLKGKGEKAKRAAKK